MTDWPRKLEMMIVCKVGFKGDNCRDPKVAPHDDGLDAENAVLSLVVRQFLAVLSGNADASRHSLDDFRLGLLRQRLRQAGRRESEDEYNRKWRESPGAHES